MTTSAELTGFFGQFLWPLFRCGAALWLMPVFGGQGVPRHVRLALAVALAYLISGQIAPIEPVDPFSAKAIAYTFEQLIIGLTFGLIMKLLFSIFTLAGRIMSMQMGLAMAEMNDPTVGSVPLLGKWLETLTTLIFLSVNGHLVVIKVLAESFHTMPIGSGIHTTDFLDLVMLGSWLFSGALLVSIPSVFSLFLVNLCFGVMSRAASQLNVFALGFPMAMMFGMFTLTMVLISLPDVFMSLTEEALGILNNYANP